MVTKEKAAAIYFWNNTVLLHFCKEEIAVIYADTLFRPKA